MSLRDACGIRVGGGGGGGIDNYMSVRWGINPKRLGSAGIENREMTLKSQFLSIVNLRQTLSALETTIYKRKCFLVGISMFLNSFSPNDRRKTILSPCISLLLEVPQG